MAYLSDIFVGFVAFLQSYFLFLEMFLWTTPKGRKIFGQTEEQAKSSAVLAANQGLYNGFLAAGLIWSLLQTSYEFAFQLKLFFLACVVIAGLYGAYSTRKKAILIFQALPAFLALCILFFNEFPNI